MNEKVVLLLRKDYVLLFFRNITRWIIIDKGEVYRFDIVDDDKLNLILLF